MKTFFDKRHFISDSADPALDLSRLLAGIEYSSIGLIIDDNVPFDDTSFTHAVFVERLQGGERCKTIATALGIISRHQCVLDSDSLICAIGGGALLDLVGLCCGLMYRGIRYVSVPTTVIAMADAAYGGKTAINVEARNQLGMYHHPELVYMNPIFLKSLPDLHTKSGMIEIAKLAVFFSDVREVLDRVCAGRCGIADAILIAATRKLELLEHDPFEKQSASVLLYGHAFGNAFEVHVRERDGTDVPHGFAVALGMLFSSWLSARLSAVSNGLVPDLSFLSAWVDPVALAVEVTPESGGELVALLLRDKYSTNGFVRVPALNSVGGYTQLPLSLIKQEYDLWRAFLLGDSVRTVSLAIG